MATLTIPDIDDTVYERLSRRAQENARSVVAEAKQIIDDRLCDVRPTRAAMTALVADLRKFHDEMVIKHGYLPDSTPLLRELRDE